VSRSERDKTISNTEGFVVVDMSVTLIHHGHVRLLRRAAEFGEVRVALTTDDEIIRYKGYSPELSFYDRKEIIESIRFVKDVVPCNWLITDEFLDEIDCKLLIHGDDNINPVTRHQVLVFPRTGGISSSELRSRAAKILRT